MFTGKCMTLFCLEILFTAFTKLCSNSTVQDYSNKVSKIAIKF